MTVPVAAHWLNGWTATADPFDPTVLASTPIGVGGRVTIAPEIWRTDVTGRRLEDLSDLFVSGSVDWSYDRAEGSAGNVSGSAMMATFVLSDTNRIGLGDCFRPYLRLGYDDGRPTTLTPFGIFTPELPTERHTEVTGESTVKGRDLTAVLRRYVFKKTYVVAAGTNFAAAIEDLIELAGLPKHRIRATAKTLGYERRFRLGTTALEAVNRLCHAIGYYRILTALDGFPATQPYRSWKNTEPVLTVTDRDPYDIVEVEHRGEVANLVMLRRNEPDKPLLKSTRRNANPSSSTSTVTIGERLYKGRILDEPDAEDQAELDALAERYLEEAGLIERTVRLRIDADPRPGILRTVDLAFGGAKAHLDGRYALVAWRVGFTDADAPIELTLRRAQAPDVVAAEAA